jgi:hypothetical protein
MAAAIPYETACTQPNATGLSTKQRGPAAFGLPNHDGPSDDAFWGPASTLCLGHPEDNSLYSLVKYPYIKF